MSLAVEPADRDASPGAAARATARAPEILLIDDCPSMQALIAAELAVDGMQVACADNGTEGIRTAMARRPDAILLDVSLPDMNGMEVCELLKVQAETAEIPVLFLSASDDIRDRVGGLDRGASDYIVKPFHADELRARVRVSLRHRTQMERESRRAMRDGLTGLWNRAYLDQRLAADATASLRHELPLSMVMIDIDHFKKLNDTHGHAMGDNVIRVVAQTILSCCRREDVACRYGGEEFAIICPNVDRDGAAVLAERIRVAVAGLRMLTPRGEIGFTCSLGVADRSGARESLDAPALLASADAALYRAKRGGRNRVELAEDDAPDPTAVEASVA